MASPTQAEIDAAYSQYQQQSSASSPDIDQAYAAYQAQQTSPEEPSFLQRIGNMAAQGIQNMRSMPYGALQGINDLGVGAQNLGAKASNAVLGTNFAQQTPENFAAKAPSQEGALAGEIGSAFMMPQVGGARLMNAASKIPKIGAEVAPYLPTALTGATYGGLYGASNPNNDMLRNMALSMAAPLGLQGLGRALGTAATAVMGRPLNKLQKTAEEEQALGIPNATLTPQQAGQNLQAATEQGMKPTLGQVSNNQGLNRTYENASYLPAASQRKESGQFMGQVQKFANDIYHNLFGNVDPMQVNPTILNNVKGVYNANREIDKANYNNVAELANTAGVNPTRESAQKYAEAELNKYNARNKANINNPLKGETGVLDILSTTSKPVGPEHPYTFNEIKEERTAIGEELNKLKENNPKATSAQHILENLYGKYTEDMENALKNSGNKELYGIWKQSNDFHSNKVAPFRKGNLPFILNKGEHESVINELLNNSEHAGIVDMLPPETRKLILGSKLMGNASTITQKVGPNGEIVAETNVTPSKLGNSYSKLNAGKNANIQNLTKDLTHVINGKEVALPEALNKLDTLHGMSLAVKKIAEEPPTGYVTKALAGGATPAILGAIGGLTGGLGALGTGALAAGTTGAAGLAGKAITKYLKNPKILQAYIDQQNRQQILQSMLPRGPNVNPAGIAGLINQGGQ